MLVIAILLLAGSFAVSALLTALMRRAAPRVGLLDRPADRLVVGRDDRLEERPEDRLVEGPEDRQEEQGESNG